jgi:Uma2 family endonuclease
MTATSSNTGLDGSINITRPHPGEHTIISGVAGNLLRLDFESEQDLVVTVVRGDLSFLFPDGGRVTLTGFYSDDMVHRRTSFYRTARIFLSLAFVVFFMIFVCGMLMGGL